MVLRFLVVFLLLAGTGFSQAFTGFLDGYWSGNFEKPLSRRNALRAFDLNHNEFSLNYAELAVEMAPAPIGFRADIGFGDAADVVHQFEPSRFTDEGIDLFRHLQQAYFSANHGKLTVDFGKWVTRHGSEVIETKDNWNYSRSLLFTWAIPFYHFGVRAALEASDALTLGADVSNGWNNVKDNNPGKTVGLMASYNRDKFTWTSNYMFGNEQSTGDDVRHLFDTYLVLEFAPQLSFMANYDYGMDRSGGDHVHWQGIAGYLKVSPVEKVSIVPRYEYFDDDFGFAMGTSATRIQEFTLTGKFDLHEQMSLWAEYRHDWASAEIFEARENDLPDSKDSQRTFSIGVVFTFTKGTP